MFYIKYITIIDVATHHNNEDDWAGKAPYDAVLNTEPAVAIGWIVPRGRGQCDGNDQHGQTCSSTDISTLQVSEWDKKHLGGTCEQKIPQIYFTLLSLLLSIKLHLFVNIFFLMKCVAWKLCLCSKYTVKTW